jgi:small subunit ribosomal protein S18
MMKKSKKDNLLIAKRKGKERGCLFCKTKTNPRWEDYEKYGEFLSPRGRIIGSQFSGSCAKHQRKLSSAIKQARHLALMPFLTK